MTIADVIERENLALRAPRPVQYGFNWPAYMSPMYRWWSVPPDMLPEMRLAEREGALAMRFRMSDGSLVIVRRKR